MARHLIQNATTGQTRIVGDAALPFFPGYAIVDTLEDGQPPSVFYGAGESDLRYVNVSELSDADSPASVALRAAFGTGGGTYRLRDYLPPLASIDNADDITSYLNEAIADMYADGGGVLEFPAGDFLIAGQIVFPNDGADKPRQPSMVWQGTAGFHSGQVQQTTPNWGGTRLRMTFQDPDYNDAKIVTRGLGRLAIRDMTMFDPSTSAQTTPFLFTTNTTLHVSGVAFIGSGTSYTGAQQDAIVLGGKRKHPADNLNNWDDPDSAFQGYGTVIERCYFDRIRRGVYGRSYCNHVVIRDNFADKRCSTNLSDGGFIEINAGLDSLVTIQDEDNDTGNTIAFNYLNGLGGYAYQVKLVGTSYCTVIGNGTPDQHTNAAFRAMVGCFSFTDSVAVAHPSRGNVVISNFVSGERPQLFEDAASTGLNHEFGTMVGGTALAAPAQVRGSFQVTANGGQGASAMDTFGYSAYIKAGFTGTTPRVWVGSKPARSVTDAVTTSGSRTVTSATAAFSAVVDTGQPIGATGIPSNTYISRVVSATEVEVSKAATASATGVTLSWGRSGTERLEIEFNRSHLVATGTAPTIAAGAAAGTTPTVSVAGRDLAGTLTITTGTTPTTGTLATVTENQQHVGTQRPMISPANQAAAELVASGGVWAARTGGTTWTVSTVAAPPASTTLLFNYMVPEAA